MAVICPRCADDGKRVEMRRPHCREPHRNDVLRSDDRFPEGFKKPPPRRSEWVCPKCNRIAIDAVDMVFGPLAVGQ